jgi:hypothetical protein
MVAPGDVVGRMTDLAGRSVGVAGQVAVGGVQGAAASVRIGTRLAGKLEHALDLHIKTLESAQPFVAALTRAIDAGLIDDLRAGLRTVETGMVVADRLTQQLGVLIGILDTATQAVRDASATAHGIMDGLPTAQAEFVRMHEVMEEMLKLMRTMPVTPQDFIPGMSRAMGLLSAPLGRPGVKPGGRADESDPSESAVQGDS